MSTLTEQDATDPIVADEDDNVPKNMTRPGQRRQTMDAGELRAAAAAMHARPPASRRQSIGPGLLPPRPGAVAAAPPVETEKETKSPQGQDSDLNNAEVEPPQPPRRIPRNSHRQSISGLPVPPTAAERPAAGASTRRRISLGPGVPRPSAARATDTASGESKSATPSKEEEEAMAPMEKETTEAETVPFDPRRKSVGPGVLAAGVMELEAASMDEQRRLSVGPGVDLTVLPNPAPKPQATAGPSTPVAKEPTSTPNSTFTIGSDGQRRGGSATRKGLTTARLLLRAQEAKERRLSKEASVTSADSPQTAASEVDVGAMGHPDVSTMTTEETNATANTGLSFLLAPTMENVNEELERDPGNTTEDEGAQPVDGKADKISTEEDTVHKLSASMQVETEDSTKALDGTEISGFAATAELRLGESTGSVGALMELLETTKDEETQPNDDKADKISAEEDTARKVNASMQVDAEDPTKTLARTDTSTEKSRLNESTGSVGELMELLQTSSVEKRNVDTRLSSATYSGFLSDVLENQTAELPPEFTSATPIEKSISDNKQNQFSATSTERRAQTMNLLFQAHEKLSLQFDKTAPQLNKKLSNASDAEINKSSAPEIGAALQTDSELLPSFLSPPAKNTRSADKRRSQSEGEDAHATDRTVDLDLMLMASPGTKGSSSKSGKTSKVSTSENPSGITDLENNEPSATKQIPNESPRRNSSASLLIDSPARHTRSSEKKRKSLEKTGENLVECGEPDRSLTNNRDPSDITGLEDDHELPSESPRSLLIDSPARHTRSSEKKRKSLEKTRDNLAECAEPDRSLITNCDSPARRTRSAEKKRKSLEEAKISTSDPSNCHTELEGTADNVLDSSPERKRSKSDSILRKGTLSSSKKSVVFGSPEYVQFNKRSPSTSLTPAKKFMFDKNDSFGHDAMGTDSADNAQFFSTASNLSKDTIQATDKSDNTDFDSQRMSIDSATVDLSAVSGRSPEESWFDMNVSVGPDITQTLTLPPDEIERTVELESDMRTLLHQQSPMYSLKPRILETVVEHSAHSIEESVDSRGSSAMDIDATGTIDQTLQLAANLGPLLYQDHSSVDNDSGVKSVSRSSLNQSSQKDQLASRGLTVTYSELAEGLPVQEGEKTDKTTGTIDQSEEYDVTTELTVTFRSPKSMQRPMPPSTTRRRRMAPMSGCRFSLTPHRRLSQDANGELIPADPHVKINSMLNYEYSPPKAPVLDLKLEELVQAANLPDQSTGIDDIISSVYNILLSCDSPCIIEKYEQLIGEISEQLTNAVQEDVNFEAMLERYDGDKEHLLDIQNVIRNEPGSNTSESLREFGNIAFASKQLELETWLWKVAVQLIDVLNEFEREMDEFSREIDDKGKFIAEEAERLTLLESKALNRARRRSLDRRKNAAASLEDEIAKLEAKYHRIEAAYMKDTEELTSLTFISKNLKSGSAIEQDIASIRSEAEHLHRNFVIVSNFSRLTPVKLLKDMFSFESIGPCPSACITVTLREMPCGNWNCDIQQQESLFNMFNGRPLKSVTPLFQNRIQSMATSASHVKIAPNTVGSYIQEIDSQLNRLQQTAMELASLKQRHAAVLFLDDEGHTFFEITFSSKTTTKMLVATFEITEAYPFSSITVALDGDIDLEAVRSLLSKSAKPGFGYLSRACNLLAAHFHCEVELA